MSEKSGSSAGRIGVALLVIGLIVFAVGRIGPTVKRWMIPAEAGPAAVARHLGPQLHALRQLASGRAKLDDIEPLFEAKHVLGAAVYGFVKDGNRSGTTVKSGPQMTGIEWFPDKAELHRPIVKIRNGVVYYDELFEDETGKLRAIRLTVSLDWLKAQAATSEPPR